MALTDDNSMVMPVTPMYGNGGGNGFGFGNDGSGWWILLLFILLGGWNNGGFGGYGGGAIPYMMNNTTNSDVQRGFDQSAIMNGITGINNAVTTGFGNVQTALCSGFAGVNAGVANGFAQAEIAANSRQMANMNQTFAAQTAMAQGFNQLGSQFADCCCENRLANCQTQNTIQNEANATRFADITNTNALMNAITAGIQSIKDDLCADRLEAERRENANLRTQLSMAQLAASQNAQTAQIEAGQRGLANEIEQYVAPNPKPAYIVSSPYCCNQAAYGCGCGA